MATAEAERRYRVIVVGASKVGKTSIIQRYLFNEFSYEVPATQIEEKTTVMVKDKRVPLLICDLAGTYVHGLCRATLSVDINYPLAHAQYSVSWSVIHSFCLSATSSAAAGDNRWL